MPLPPGAGPEVQRESPPAVWSGSGLPWLTPEQYEARREIDRKIDRLLDEGEIATQFEECLYSVCDILSQVERETLKADELLEQWRSGWLTPQHWRKLSCLIRWNSQALPQYQARLGRELGRLVEGGLLSEAEATVVKESLKVLGDTHDYLAAGRLPWADAVGRIETRLPGGGETPAIADSRVVSGGTLVAWLKRPHASGQGTPGSVAARYGHVPNLDRSDLANGSGQSTFAALRHRFIGAHELDGATLRGLGDDSLKALVGAGYIEAGREVSDATARERQIDDCCRRIGTDPAFAERSAAAMRMRSGKTMGRELIAIALGSYPPMLDWARGGATAEVCLASVSVLKAGEFEAWAAQRDSLAALERENPAELEVPGTWGEPCKVRADVAVREFVLWADKPELVETSPYGTAEARAGRLQQFRRLLGSEHSADLGGAVVEAGEEIESMVQQLRDTLGAQASDYEHSVLEHGEDHPVSLDSGGLRANGQEDLAFFERQGRALREAARQLKAMWLENGDWPAGVESHRPAAARLALVAHLMRETPLLSCGGDSNLTAQLDSDAKLLATVADSQDGRLPPANLDEVVWRGVRRDFAAR